MLVENREAVTRSSFMRSKPRGVLDTSARNDTQFLDQKQGVDAFARHIDAIPRLN